MQTVSLGVLMPNPIFLGKNKKNIIKLSSAEFA